MTCVDGCGESEKGAGFRRYLDILNTENRLFNVPIELVGAVCLRESEGYRWFNLTDKQYRQNMAAWREATGKTESALLQYVKYPAGVNKGLIAKFRYEPSWKAPSFGWAQKSDNKEFFQRVMPLSFGFGQKAMWIYLAGYTPKQWTRLFYRFLDDPYVQLIQVAKDLDTLIKTSRGNVPLALTRYNAGPKAQRVSEYGDAVFKNYKVLLSHKNKE